MIRKSPVLKLNNSLKNKNTENEITVTKTKQSLKKF